MLAARLFSLLAVFGGGALAAFAIRESAASDFTYAAQKGLSGIFVTPQWAGTIAVVVAGATLTTLLRMRNRGAAAGVAVAGAVAIGLPDVVAVATAPACTINAIGAGLLLAVSTYSAAGRRDRLVALSIGVLAATMFFGVAGMWRVPTGRWAVTLPGDTFHVTATVPLPILAAVVVILAALVSTTSPPEPGVSIRSAVAGIGLPLVFLVLYLALGSTESGPVAWTLAVALAVALVLGAAWWLPPDDGRILLLGLALTAVTIGQVYYSIGAELWLLGGLPLIVGTVAGWKYPAVSMPLGSVLLIVVTASGLLPATDTVKIVSYALVLPGALGLSAASVLSTAPVDPLVVPITAAFPSAMTFFAVSAPAGPVELVWSNGFPKTEPDITISVAAPLPSSVVVAVVTAALAIFGVLRLSSPGRVPENSFE